MKAEVVQLPALMKTVPDAWAEAFERHYSERVVTYAGGASALKRWRQRLLRRQLRRTQRPQNL